MIKRINLFVMTILLASLSIIATAQTNELLFSELFNEVNPKIQLKNGASLGSNGSGVSGKSDDKAYVSEVKNFDDQLNSPVVLLSEMPQVNGLEELTIAFWFKASDKQSKEASLFNAASMYMITDGKGGWVLRVGAEAEKGVMYWFYTGNKGPLVEWSKSNEWIFGAFAWKRSTGEVCIYQGTKKDAIKLQRCQKRPETVSGLRQRSATDKRMDVIGNTLDTKFNRPFNGSIDNFRIYSKSLEIKDVEKIRQADVKNEMP